MTDIDDGYTFYKGLDSIGYDLCFYQDKTVEELKKLCESNDRCIGFNTLGYLKFYINKVEDLKSVGAYKRESDGLYINDNKYKKIKNLTKNKTFLHFDDYKFYPNKDSGGNDYKFVANKSIEDLKEMCDNNEDCKGFNTLGFLKSEIKPEREFINLNNIYCGGGLYVKNKKILVKLLCNWCSSKDLCEDWNRMSQGDYRWNDIEITWQNEADYFVIINKPLNDSEFYIPNKTIIFQMEPWCDDPNQKWGVKTWGFWAEPDPSVFLHVRTHRNYYNNCFWQLQMTYNEFKTKRIEKDVLKENIVSSICSSKYFDPGHIKRIDFMKYVEDKNDDLVRIDIYNHDNVHNFKNYKGPHPPNNKNIGIVPYKYYFMGENNVEKNFITEKIWEPLLCESLCFYWGCPNISDYIDPRAFILLDLDDFEKSFNVMKTAILNNEWEKRLDIIRREKQKVLEYYNFFPTLERIIQHDLKLKYKPSDDELIYHKYFNNLIGKKITQVGFIHCCIPKNNIFILNELMDKYKETKLIDVLDYLYVINIGDDIPQFEINNKIKIINYSKNINLFEKPTINLIHTFCLFNPNVKILYVHTKGSSYNPIPQTILDWKNYMLFFLMDKFQFCLDLLDLYDTVGCNYLENPQKHFSGNFWWANSYYIKTLTKIESNVRHDCEWWILSNPNANKHILFNSEINHYMSIYPRIMYDNEKTNKIIEEFYTFNTNLKIKCINLERRSDRKDNMITKLTKVNLIDYCDFFKAIDGQELLPTEEIIKLFENNDFGSRRTFIGCALSHFNLWKQLIEDQTCLAYMVLEDDIEFETSFLFKFNYANKFMDYNEFDMLYLGYTFYEKDIKIYNEKIKDIKKTLSIGKFDKDLSIGGFFGYIITKSGVTKLLNFIEKNGIKHGIDYLPIRYGEEIGLVQYEVLPHLINTKFANFKNKIDSDIQYDFNKLF